MLKSAVDVTEVSANERFELPSNDPPSSDSGICTEIESLC